MSLPEDDIPEIDIKLHSVNVTAKTRKLRATWDAEFLCSKCSPYATEPSFSNYVCKKSKKQQLINRIKNIKKLIK